mmetsp:Transcript_85730/g.232489  ORF Transcript_85730/g.232489 Transcript_85730/m.232489 type:complete len:838 (+) Transcript_85730:58-2571(+)
MKVATHSHGQRLLRMMKRSRRLAGSIVIAVAFAVAASLVWIGQPDAPPLVTTFSGSTRISGGSVGQLWSSGSVAEGGRSALADATAERPMAAKPRSVENSAMQKPSLDWPPPAASLTWPRWLPFLAAAYAGVQGIRRKLLGGAEAVALDPALPWSVRWELIKSRKELRAKGTSAPRSFRSMLKESADTLEEMPALLVTVAVLAGDALRRQKGYSGPNSLNPFRRLGEAQALLFTAGRLHLGMKGDIGQMRLLGGDFLFAEGQWTMAELGSLPAIRCTCQMIRDVSDGCSEGGAAATSEGKLGILGAKAALRAAYLRAGAYFAMVAGGSGWVSGAPVATVQALRRYGAALGCAMKLAQYHDDLLSQDMALWLARSAQEALAAIGPNDSGALSGMRRLAFRLERSCKASLKTLERSGNAVQGLSFGEFSELQRELEQAVLFNEGAKPGDDETMAAGPGFQRDSVAEKELEHLISSGLYGPFPEPAAPVSLKVEGGPKAAMDGSLKLIGRELLEVNRLLDGALLSEPAFTDVVRKEVIELFSTSGKRLRPALVLLVARALGAPTEKLQRVASLAASIEVLHCASLVHDDILDASELRRGVPTSHMRLGERQATLVGDFLFATASCLVAELGSMSVVLLISKVVADFGRGELAQNAVRFEAVAYSLEDYLAKSFYKTASLLAAACQAAAVLSGVAPDSKEAGACYRFGAYIGLAFQVVDDVLDFTSTEEELGKPALADLKEGNLSAPVLFAAQTELGSHGGKALESAHRRELVMCLERRLSEDGDLERVMALVAEADGVAQSKSLARNFADLAVAELAALPEGEARRGLCIFAEFVVARTY